MYHVFTYVSQIYMIMSLQFFIHYITCLFNFFTLLIELVLLVELLTV